MGVYFSCGLGNIEEHRHDPKILLDKNQSKIELLDIVEARPFGIIFHFHKVWSKYRTEIARHGLAYPDILLIKGMKTRL